MAKKMKAVQLEHLKVEMVPVDDLLPNSYNPNRQSEKDFELLKQSMRDDGFTQPIVAQDDKIIVDGEHRWRAARELGFTRVPVVFVNMGVEQMRLSTLRHNRARGTEDFALTQALMRDLQALGALDVAVRALDIGEEELGRLLTTDEVPVVRASDEFSPAWEPVATRREVLASEGDNRMVSSTAAAGNFSTSKGSDFVEATYRLNLVYSGEEAALVKAALGSENTSTRFLECCRRHRGV